MTEEEWLGCNDPHALLRYIGKEIGERKLRLLACACSRRVWPVFRDAESLALNVGEDLADGLVPELERDAAYEAASKIRGSVMRSALCTRVEHLSANFERLLRWTAAVERTRNESGEPTGGPAPEEIQARLVRDLLGNPFQTNHPPPSSAELTSLALAAYEDRITAARLIDPVRLSILADALEDAGCDDANILAHCRDGGVHVRGCWVLDLILTKT